MRFLLEPPLASSATDVAEAGIAARDGGLDGVLLTASPALPAPLVVAASLAAAVEGILIAAEVALGDRHPLEVAEEAAVVDLASAGRLVLVARPAAGHEEHFGEALDLLRTALAPRPFRFAGARWAVPANLPQHGHDADGRARTTPATFQPQLRVWTAGDRDGAGPRRGLGHVAGARDDPQVVAEMWDEASAALGVALIGTPRGRRMPWTGPQDLLDQLHGGRAAFDQDWAIVTAEASAARAIGAEVRPRIQLDRLPAGLEAFWDREGPSG